VGQLKQQLHHAEQLVKDVPGRVRVLSETTITMSLDQAPEIPQAVHNLRTQAVEAMGVMEVNPGIAIVETPTVPCPQRRSERVTQRIVTGKLGERGGFSHKWTLAEFVAFAEGMLAHGYSWSPIALSNPILRDLGRKQCCQQSKALEFKAVMQAQL
jgi:hypothetical protein